MKIVFSDVDGVFNCKKFLDAELKKKSGIELDESKIKILKRICDETGAKVVIASTWKPDTAVSQQFMNKWNTLVDVLNRNGIEVFDITPNYGSHRPLEISEWLGSHSGVESFVILDDDYSSDDYEDVCLFNCLIQTSYYAKAIEKGGLTDELADLAIKKLNKVK